MRIAVIGAGLMGRGIAQSLATGGHEISLVDRDERILDQALAAIELSLSTLAEHGSIAAADIATVQSRIVPVADSAIAARGAEAIVEAVPEVPDLKRLVIQQLDAEAPASAPIMSNTSGLDVFAIASDRMKHPERLITAHWYAPPHIIPLVEVAPGPLTAPDIVQRTASLLQEAGKVPLVMKTFAPGFVVNKIQHSYARAMFDLMASGIVEPSQIDLAIKYVLGVRLPIVGIIQSIDFNGLETVRNICRSLEIEVPALDALVNAGHLGPATGRGIYDYGDRSEAEILKQRDLKFLKMIDALKEMDAFTPI